MTRRIALATLLVRDCDEALAFFVGALGFAVAEDKPLDDAGRCWMAVVPPGGGAGLLLARVEGEEQRAAVGRQAAGLDARPPTRDVLGRPHPESAVTPSRPVPPRAEPRP